MSGNVWNADNINDGNQKREIGMAGINYVLDGGAYLNFTDLPSTEAMKLEVGGRVRSNGMSEGWRWWRKRLRKSVGAVAEFQCFKTFACILIHVRV